MKNVRNKIEPLALALATGLTTTATHAGVGYGVPVIDAANLAMNTANTLANEANAAANLENALANTASAVLNGFQLKQLKRITHQLSDASKGTVIHHTVNIDKSMEFNTQINKTFTWIINGSGDEIIPIPREVKDKLENVRGGQSTDAYTSHYQSVDDYAKDALGRFGDHATSESSRARKAANVALVEAIASDEVALDAEATAMKKLAEMNKIEGHGNQLQVANALSAAQINQLAKLRSMMLVAETARVAELQAKADSDARAVAVGKQLRAGLSDAMERTRAKPVSY